MKQGKKIAARLGYRPPLIESGRTSAPDRREISMRWLCGTFLTGITSSLLMGTALFIALDERQRTIIEPSQNGDGSKTLAKGHQKENKKSSRLVDLPRIITGSGDRKRLEIKAVTREGEKNVIRNMPLVEINIGFATNYKADKNDPSFDPLIIAMEDEPMNLASSIETPIYSHTATSETILKTSPFPLAARFENEKLALPTDDIEKMVRTAAKVLSNGEIKVASLHFFLLNDKNTVQAPEKSTDCDITITPENFSASPMVSSNNSPPYSEDIILVPDEISFEEAFAQANHTNLNAKEIARQLAQETGMKSLPTGSVLRLLLDNSEIPKILRATLYQGARYVVTMALDDNQNYVKASEPSANPALRMAFNNASLDGLMPQNFATIYDSIFRAARFHGLSQKTTRQLLRTLGTDIDLQSRVGAADKMKLLFSEPDDQNRLSKNSELLYMSTTFQGKIQTLYRYQNSDGIVDYFDSKGQSAKKILIRNPVPNGRFTSHFGSRRHPILGYIKPHLGVDWSAPRGTPILAAGNGIVQKSGWESGYGKQTVIQHPNGYVTSYGHQSIIPRGITPGAKVRQGQIIGYVGSTGLSTGAHLHYELSVNGRKVDPMRIRYPAAQNLTGNQLSAFRRDRNRIDTLLQSPVTKKMSRKK